MRLHHLLSPAILLLLSLHVPFVLAQAADQPLSTVTIGDGETSEGDLNGKTLPLAQALERLPATGGRIMILPGNYEVAGPAEVKAPNVSIAGSGASTRITVSSAEGDVDFIRVEPAAERFALSDMTIGWEPADGERALVRILSAGSRVTDCHFLWLSRDERAGWASGVSVGSGEPMLSGVWIARNEFSTGVHGRGVRLERCVSVFVSDNKFNGNLSGPSEGLHSLECNQQQFTGNTFLNMGSRNPEALPSVGLHVDNATGDMGHMQVTGNHFHTIFGTGSCALKATRPFFSTISGNVFGRVQGVGASAIHLSHTVGVAVSGNTIENCNPAGDGAAVRIEAGASGLNIASNTFAGNYNTEMGFFASAGAGWTAVSVLGNLFDSHAHPHEAAIVLEGGVARGMAVVGNTLSGFAGDDPIKIASGKDVRVENNVILATAPKEAADPASGEGAKVQRPAGR